MKYLQIVPTLLEAAPVTSHPVLMGIFLTWIAVPIAIVAYLITLLIRGEFKRKEDAKREIEEARFDEEARHSYRGPTTHYEIF